MTPAVIELGQGADPMHLPVGERYEVKKNGESVSILSTELGYTTTTSAGVEYHAPSDESIKFDGDITVSAEPIPLKSSPFDDPML